MAAVSSLDVFLITASNNRDSSASSLTSSLKDGFLPSAPFLPSLRYRTDLVAPVVFLITPRHGPHTKHSFQQYLYCCMLSVAAGTYCLETNIVTDPFARNGCFSGSTVLALIQYAAILWYQKTWINHHKLMYQYKEEDILFALTKHYQHHYCFLFSSELYLGPFGNLKSCWTVSVAGPLIAWFERFHL
jgi:hypothetical protein